MVSRLTDRNNAGVVGTNRYSQGVSTEWGSLLKSLSEGTSDGNRNAYLF